MLDRLGVRYSLRLAALRMRETGRKGELYTYSRKYLTECLNRGDIDLAMKLLEDQKDKLGWALVLGLVQQELERLLEGGRCWCSQPVQRMVNVCDMLG